MSDRKQTNKERTKWEKSDNNVVSNTLVRECSFDLVMFLTET